MRELKFRTLVDGRWVYGAVAPRDGDREIHMEKFWNIVTYGGKSRRETLGQWTGLLDKSWVEIYEGDICNFGTMQGDIASVVWMSCGSFGFDICGHVVPFSEANLECACVIGNIHENPELLEDD